MGLGLLEIILLNEVHCGLARSVTGEVHAASG
jgi:hypothetical protein